MEYVQLPITWSLQKFPTIDHTKQSKNIPDKWNFFVPMLLTPVKKIPKHSEWVDLKEWFKTNITKYSMFGRFSIVQYNYHIDRFFLGYLFHINKEDEACHFALRWLHLTS